MRELSPSRCRSPSAWLRCAASLLLALLLGTALAARADEAQANRRVQLGAKVFPAVVAADQDLAHKVSGDGKIHLVVLYRDDAEGAAQSADRIGATKHIKDFPVLVTILPYTHLNALGDSPPAALFLAEPAAEGLPAITRFAVEHHRLLFSPFYGDVTAGAQTGLFVSDRIVPLVNLPALQAAGIQLKPFFLEVARTHE